jgi:parvulin-like peptidyl-prolyl isomerase
MAARRAEAQKIREALAGGADFATLARKVSQDEKAALGGDCGWMAASELRAELAEAAKGLAAGGISPVVEAGGDCYILKVEERQAAGRVSFEEARPEIEKRLRKQESERLYDAWIERLKREAYVEIVAPDAF